VGRDNRRARPQILRRTTKQGSRYRYDPDRIVKALSLVPKQRYEEIGGSKATLSSRSPTLRRSYLSARSSSTLRYRGAWLGRAFFRSLVRGEYDGSFYLIPNPRITHLDEMREGGRPHTGVVGPVDRGIFYEAR
jgi:hypothetical protein